MPTIYEEGFKQGRKDMLLEIIKNFSSKMTVKEIIESLKIPEVEFQEIKKELENIEKEGKP